MPNFICMGFDELQGAGSKRKFKVKMNLGGFGPATFCTVGGRLRPLGHSD